MSKTTRIWTRSVLSSIMLALPFFALAPTANAGTFCPEMVIVHPEDGKINVYDPITNSWTATPSPDGKTYTVSQAYPWEVHHNCVHHFTITITVTAADGTTWTDSSTHVPNCVHGNTSGSFTPPPLEPKFKGGEVNLNIVASPRCEGVDPWEQQNDPCDTQQGQRDCNRDVIWADP